MVSKCEPVRVTVCVAGPACSALKAEEPDTVIPVMTGAGALTVILTAPVPKPLFTVTVCVPAFAELRTE